MKTTEQQTVHSLKYKVTKTKNGKDFIISIKLADECKNGHNDFSITGEIYPTGKRGDKNTESCGAIGDKIAKCFPEFQIFEDLHLSDVNGAPMYASANGFYHLKNSPIETAAEYLRIPVNEAERLKATSEDEKHFCYNLMRLDIPRKWKAQAQKAIEILEGLTGEKFKDNSTRLQSVELTGDELKDIEEKVKSGYYSQENIFERKLEKQKAEKRKQFDDIKQDFDKEVKKSEDEYNVKFAVLSAGLSIKGFIYYNHKNEGVFNIWEWEKKITEDQFNEFLEFIRKYEGKLPEGITFKLK